MFLSSKLVTLTTLFLFETVQGWLIVIIGDPANVKVVPVGIPSPLMPYVRPLTNPTIEYNKTVSRPSLLLISIGVAAADVMAFSDIVPAKLPPYSNKTVIALPSVSRFGIP